MHLLLDNPLGEACKVDLRMDNSLHAKLFIFDDTETIVTSSNLTYAGFYKNREVALATSDPDIVKVTVEHFQRLFANSAQLTSDMVTEVRRQLRGIAVTLPDEYAEEVKSPSITEEEEHLDSIPLDTQLIAKIDNSVRERLTEDLVQNTVSFDADTSQVQAEHISENRFYEDVLGRFLSIFGPPAPTIRELATVFAHLSAYQQLTIAAPDRNQGEALAEIGKHVEEVIVAQLVAEESSITSTGESISTKVSCIVTSNYFVSQLNLLGLCRSIIGKGMARSAPDVAATKRGLEGIASLLVAKLTGYLFLTRPWSELLNKFRRILRLKEDFPFESYRHENYKSRLQQLCQEQYGATPEYKIIKREGPDHDTHFTVEVWAGRKHSKVLAQGYGSNRKEAETDAAYNALRALADQGSDSRVPSQSEKLPNSLHRACRQQGKELLKRLCGIDLPDDMCEAVLLPFKHDEVKVKVLRSVLAAIGGKVRELMAYRVAFKDTPDRGIGTSRVSAINANRRIVSVFLETPMGAWLRWLEKDVYFRGATEAQPTIVSVNALIGAVFTKHDFEACRPLETLLFPDVTKDIGVDYLSPISKLQAMIQGVVKNRYTELFQVSTTSLNPPSEAHNPRIEVKLVMAGTVIGKAVAKRKKDAMEEACKMALENPLLPGILDTLKKA
jgi:dsRNA-specific ribonuclease